MSPSCQRSPGPVFRNDPSSLALDAANDARDTSAMAIDSPPRPPSQDELGAFIREARVRQLRRRLLGTAVIAIIAAASLGIHAIFSGAARAPRAGASDSGLAAPCPLSALPLSLQPQGTATQAVFFLTIRNPQHLTCSINVPAVLEITENGQRAPISDNPLRAKLHATLRGERSTIWPPSGAWWANWCGSHQGFSLTARVGSHSVSTRIGILPQCFGTGNHSKLRLGM
jgi:hypothetical protein